MDRCPDLPDRARVTIGFRHRRQLIDQVVAGGRLVGGHVTREGRHSVARTGEADIGGPLRPLPGAGRPPWRRAPPAVPGHAPAAWPGTGRTPRAAAPPPPRGRARVSCAGARPRALRPGAHRSSPRCSAATSPAGSAATCTRAWRGRRGPAAEVDCMRHLVGEELAHSGNSGSVFRQVQLRPPGPPSGASSVSGHKLGEPQDQVRLPGGIRAPGCAGAVRARRRRPRHRATTPAASDRAQAGSAPSRRGSPPASRFPTVAARVEHTCDHRQSRWLAGHARAPRGRSRSSRCRTARRIGCRP